MKFEINIPVTVIKNIAIILLVIAVGYNLYYNLKVVDFEKIKDLSYKIDSLQRLQQKALQVYDVELDSFKKKQKKTLDYIDSITRVQRWYNSQFKHAIKTKNQLKKQYEENLKHPSGRSADSIGKSIRSNI